MRDPQVGDIWRVRATDALVKVVPSVEGIRTETVADHGNGILMDWTRNEFVRECEPPQPWICNACGQPLGTGTLLDLRPEPIAGSAVPAPIWQRFARRYKCPVCASVHEQENGDGY